MGAGLRVLVLGRLVGCRLREVEDLLKGYRILDATVKVYGEATIDDVEDAIFESTVYRPVIIVANKTDAPEARKNLRELERLVGDQMLIVPVSCEKRQGLGKLGKELFKSLGIMRVYTKEPSDREPSPNPFVLKKGATVMHLARQIHSDFIERFSHARVWSHRLPFSPQKVGASFILEDKDVVELHAK